jgi:geranylgeranyl transferase type-2 subunit alpha
MHGRKKGSVVATPQEKIDKYNKLKVVVLAKYKARVFTATTQKLTETLIKLNPDFYTLWNYEREILEHQLAQGEAAGERVDLARLSVAQLELCNAGLQRNPKSYCAWHHRRWVVGKGATDVVAELALCSKMLTLDKRNFHCWNYRRFVADRCYEQGKATLASEFAFTSDKIEQDFSNFSAWHYRSVLLVAIENSVTAWTAHKGDDGDDDDEAAASVSIESAAAQEGSGKEEAVVVDTASETKKSSSSSSSAHDLESHGLGGFMDFDEVLDKELVLLKTALFVDPHDQSAWLYHRWLMARYLPHLDGSGAQGGVVIAFGQESSSSSATKKGEEGKEKKQEGQKATSPSLPAHQCVHKSKRTPEQHASLFRGEIDMCRELLALEPRCKWALLALCLLLGALSRLPAGESTREQALSEIKTTMQTLLELDPLRAGYYQDVHEKIIK